jgi:hypothetical protein
MNWSKNLAHLKHLKEIVELIIAKRADINAKGLQTGDDVAKGGVWR